MTFEPDSVHRGHDPLLIAEHAAGDLSGPPAKAAETLIADCSDCAALDRDLRALARATRAVSGVAPAPRDFRLSPAQAARLRGGPWWRRAIRILTEPRGVGRPIATAFTTLGLAGLLFGSLPTGAFLPMAASTGDRNLVHESSSAAPAPAAASAPSAAPGVVGQPAAQGSDGRTSNEFGGGLGAGLGTPTDAPKHEPTTATGGSAGSTDLNQSSPQPTTPLVAVSIGLLAVGLGLFAVRRLGRRIA